MLQDVEIMSARSPIVVLEATSAEESERPARLHREATWIAEMESMPIEAKSVRGPTAF